MSSLFVPKRLSWANINRSFLWRLLLVVLVVATSNSRNNGHSAYGFSTSIAVFPAANKRSRSNSWSPALPHARPGASIYNHLVVALSSTASDDNDSKDTPPVAPAPQGEQEEAAISPSEEQEQKEAVGNLVANDEWAGLSMELSELVKTAVVEDIKTNAREFLGKDEYKIGDITKQIDTKVKEGVANLRDKDEYEIGDFTLLLDQTSKKMTEELTGKPYEVGDLSREIDRRVKNAVAGYVGKDEYEAGDLSRAVASNVSKKVEELTANYEFGDISREVERQRKEWVKGFLGEEAAANYKFGDISKKFATKITGKDEYQFGDVTKKLLGDLFGDKGGDKSKN